MGYEFDVLYMECINNKAADALSRKHGAEDMSLILDNAHEGLLEMIQSSWVTDPVLQKLISDLTTNPMAHTKYSWVRHELRRKGKLVIGVVPALKSTILKWLHD